MSELSLFFAQNVACDTTEEFVVSQRFKDKEGNAVAWKLRSMTEDENQECRKLPQPAKSKVKTECIPPKLSLTIIWRS